MLNAGNLKGPPRRGKPMLRNVIGVRIGLDVDMAFPVGVAVSDIFDHLFASLVSCLATGSRLVPVPVLIASKGLYGASAVAQLTCQG